MRFAHLFVSVLLVAAIGCDLPDRVSRLEKQNQELQAQMKRSEAVADYDLQAKCSKDARIWFNENWRRDKDTALLDFTNHYNKKMNKCFISVEYHYDTDLAAARGTSWTNDITLMDVYENMTYGTFNENHYTYWKPEITTRLDVITCKVYGQDCKSGDEFQKLIYPFFF